MITRYVNTASTAGGDGTTNGTVGATRAFASLAEAVDSYAGGSLPDHVRIYCSGTVADTATSATSGSGYYLPFNFTTTPTSYLEVIGDNTTGQWDTAAYRIEKTDLNLIGGSTAAHVRLYNLQVMLKVTDGAPHYVCRPAAPYWNVTGGAGYWFVKNCLLRTDPSSTSGYVLGFQNYDPASSGQVYHVNCVLWGTTTNSGNGFETDHTVWARDNVFSYNCTVYRHYSGFTNNQLVVNCLGAGSWSGADFVGVTGHHNASSDATATGTGSRTNQTFTWVDSANGDFHLDSTDAGALGHGATDPASGLYLDDMAGTVRPAAWAIGALEEPSSAGGSGGGFSALSGVSGNSGGGDIDVLGD